MPNYLLIAFDDLALVGERYRDHSDALVSLADQSITPNLDRLMAEGATFKRCYSNIAVCNPSRSSFLTGQSPIRTQVLGNFVRWPKHIAVADMMPAILAAQGWTVGIAGKVHHPDGQGDTALAAAIGHVDGTNVRFTKFVADGDEGDTGSENTHGVTAIPDSDTTQIENLPDYVAATAAINHINAHGGIRPWAFFCGFYKPHQPLKAPQSYFDMYPLDSIVVPDINVPYDALPEFAKSMLSNENYHRQILREHVIDGVTYGGEYGYWPRMIQAYLACLTWADAQLGRVLAALDAKGAVEVNNTVVDVLSDHGYHMGDKDRWRKFTLWEEATRVPRVVRYPNAVPAGLVIDQPTDLLSVLPTAFDLLGASTAGLTLDGASYADLLRVAGFAPSHIPVTWMYGSWSAISPALLRYTRYEDGTRELHDLAVDPDQHDNLLNNPDIPAHYLTDMEALIDAVKSVQTIIEGTPGANVRLGTVGIDIFAGYQGPDEFTGGIGNDIYISGEGPHQAKFIEEKGGGVDHIHARDTSTNALGPNVEHYTAMQGANQSGRIVGNFEDNVITGGGGTNEIYGSGGNDVLQSGGGVRDRLYGGPGDDELYGPMMGARDAYLDGGSGNDTITGTPGTDTIRAGPSGATGTDTAALGNDDNLDRIIVDAKSSGKLTVTQWKSANDRIQVKGSDFGLAVGASAAARALAVQVGSSTVITFTSTGAHPNAVITLQGVTATTLTDANFEVV